MSKKQESTQTIVITVFAILIILVLSYLFFYFAVKSQSLSDDSSASVSSGLNINPEKKEPTNVITFGLPEVLPKQQKEGDCFSASVADPFRQDAFRCRFENEIYDPCFATEKKDIVFCQLNPLAPEAFLIKLKESLPEVVLLENINESWAWFVKLDDGTYCSPFTGTRPFFGEDKIAYYGCKSDIENEQVVLIGDLIAGNIWKVNKAVVAQEGDSWIIKSEEEVKINTVWQ